MTALYTGGDYLDETKTWHAEDSPWKAGKILEILTRNGLTPAMIGEVGSGAGRVLHELSQQPRLAQSEFFGYEISPQALALSRQVQSERVCFSGEDFFASTDPGHFDLLLAIDVMEHVPDYLGFLANCRTKADYKLYHIPLEVSVSAVLRDAMTQGRYSVGHLHYFTERSALETLRDSGHEIVDCLFTDQAVALYRLHPTAKKAVANLFRAAAARISVPLSARVFGGYSLLVLTR